MDPFVAEIRIFTGNFPPRGWALCNGQLLPISQNTALFSLLGTTYGGNGKSNFALPDIQGRAVVQPGQGPGLSLRDLGETGGSETVTLTQTQMPSHSHALLGQNADGPFTGPQGHALAQSAAGIPQYAPAANVTMHADGLTDAGSGLPHNNVQPYQVLNYIIALQGVFPPRG